MTTAEFCARMDTIASRLRATCERLNIARARLRPSMREAMASEPSVLPHWPAKRTVCTRTVFVRRDMGKSEVDFLQQLLRLPDPMTALATYRAGHHRVLQPKRVLADPDPVDTTWRDRPERQMTPEDLIREQFSGRSLRRELGRLR